MTKICYYYWPLLFLFLKKKVFVVHLLLNLLNVTGVLLADIKRVLLKYKCISFFSDEILVNCNEKLVLRTVLLV